MLSPRDLAYSLGSFSGAVIEATVSTFAIFYYVDVLKVPAGLISTAMLWCGIWHAVSNPLFGHISDRTRTRWGRRTPYVAGLALPLCLAFTLLWLPPCPPGAADLLYPYYFAVMFLVSGLFTAVMLNLTALYPEMYPEIEDRARVSALRQALAMLGIIVGAAAPPLLYSTLGWRAMGVILGAVSLVTMYAALYGCKERPEFASARIADPVELLRLTLFNRSFLAYVVASMLVQYTFVDLQAVIPFYAKYVLGATDTQTSLLLGLVFATAIPTAWAWARIAPRLSPTSLPRRRGYKPSPCAIHLAKFLHCMLVKHLTASRSSPAPQVFVRGHGHLFFRSLHRHPVKSFLQNRLHAAVRTGAYGHGAFYEAIWEELEVLNQKPFQKLEGSPQSLFEKLDRPALRPLPAQRYEFAQWKKARVNLDYHIEVDHNYYSVPHAYVHKEVEVRLTAGAVEILCSGQRIASHRRCYRRGHSTTEVAHMPKAHQKHLDRTPSRFIEEATAIGPETAALARAILEDQPHPEQGYRSRLGILRLARRYPKERMEAAAKRALQSGVRSYRRLQSVLDHGLDRAPLEPRPQLPPYPTPTCVAHSTLARREQVNVNTRHPGETAQDAP